MGKLGFVRALKVNRIFLIVSSLALFCEYDSTALASAGTQEQILILSTATSAPRFENIVREVRENYQRPGSNAQVSLAVSASNPPDSSGRRTVPGPNWAGFDEVTHLEKLTEIDKFLSSHLGGLSQAPQACSAGKENALVFITGHGVGPQSREELLGGGLPVFGSHGVQTQYSNHNLQNVIRDCSGPDRFIRLVGTHCYSGGLSNIVFDEKIPNICSASSTDGLHFGWSSDEGPPGGISLYGQAFFNELKHREFPLGKTGSVSLLEAHLSGFLSDSLNDGRAQLSSLAYVDYVLHEGPYGPDNSLQMAAPPREVIRTKTDLLKNARVSKGFQASGRDSKCPEIAAAPEVVNIFRKMQALVDSQLGAELSVEELNTLPEELRSAYLDLLANPKIMDTLRAGPTSQATQTYEEWQTFDRESREQFAKLAKKPASRQRTAMLKQLEDERLKQISKTEAKLDEEIKVDALINNFRKLSENLKRAASFMKAPLDKVSSAQKQKFLNLLKCELQPI